MNNILSEPAGRTEMSHVEVKCQGRDGDVGLSGEGGRDEECLMFEVERCLGRVIERNSESGR